MIKEQIANISGMAQACARAQLRVRSDPCSSGGSAPSTAATEQTRDSTATAPHQPPLDGSEASAISLDCSSLRCARLGCV